MNARLAIVVGAAAAACSVSAVELSSDWRIVSPKHEAAVVGYGFEQSAKLLQRDLAEGAGLSLEIVKTAPKAGPAIFLGADLARAAGINTDDLAWYDNAIVEKGGSLYLFGNDRARSKNANRHEWFKAALPTVGATVRFLHDYLGDRFCAPGETGRHVGRRDKVVVPDGTRSVERPSQIYGHAYRQDMIYSYGAGMRGMGLFHSYGGHTYPSAVSIEKYGKDHPEYFAQTRQGRRTGDQPSPVYALCISNPEVEDLIVAELLRKFDEGAEVCQLAQNDGDQRCFCDKCRALFGTGDDWNEKFWRFHRRIAERIEKLRPGKVVNILCYGNSKRPPRTFTKFPSNVMVELCVYSEETFAEWSRYDVPQGFTVYVYFWGPYQQPGFVARHSFAFLADNARRFRRNGVKGVYRCGYGDLFGLEGPGYHVFNEVLVDPERPVDAIVAEYCQAMFGPAAGLMQQFYDAQDERLRGVDLVREGFPSASGNGLGRYLKAAPKNNGDLHAWAYPPETAKAMEDYLARAEATEGLSDKERRRLDLVRREFDYAKAMGEIGCLYSAYKWRPTQASFDALAEALLARRQAMLGLSNGKGGSIELPGWPELTPLGRGTGPSSGAYWLEWNGRLSGMMGAPLAWDVKLMKEKGILPGVTMPEQAVVRAAQAPTLDELVAGAGAWSRSTEARLRGIQGEESVRETTTFRLACDESCLYVGVKTDLPADVAVPVFDADGKVWKTETLDLLIAPAKSTDVNFHLLWTPAADSRLDYARGLVTDPLHPLYGVSDISWSGKWQHEDRRVGNAWYSLLKIPYSDLGVAAAPGKGEVWRFNLGRIAYPKEEPRGSLSLWSPNLDKRTMDNPDAMGRIIFE